MKCPFKYEIQIIGNLTQSVTTQKTAELSWVIHAVKPVVHRTVKCEQRLCAC